jgi:hypothetical protein
MPRRLAIGAAGALLIAFGVAIGTRFERSDRDRTLRVTVTTGSRSTPPVAEAMSARTTEGAVAAATAYVRALDGSVLLDAGELHRTLEQIASESALAALARAYEQAGTDTRTRLGVGTRPEPVVIVRAAPLGYRVESFTLDEATVSIWRVGIVGSGATVEPRQSWRTQTVSLVWERGDWKVTAFASTPGPTPPLATAADEPADLFALIPQFREFHGVQP